MALSVDIILNARDEASGHLDKFGRGLRDATQTARAMAGSLLSELNPALGTFVSSMTFAAREAAKLPVALGAVTVGIAAATAALIPYVQRLREANEFQIQFSLAVRGADFGSLRGQLDQQVAAMERFRNEADRIRQPFTGIRSETDRLIATFQRGFGPSIDDITGRIIKLKEELAGLAPGLTAGQIVGTQAAQARVRAGAPEMSVEQQIGFTQEAFRLERVQLQQEAANKIQAMQAELRAILAPGIAEEAGARILLSAQQEAIALRSLRLKRPFAPVGGIPSPEAEEAMFLPGRLSAGELEGLVSPTMLPGFIRTQPPVDIHSAAEEALLPPRMSPGETDAIGAPFRERALQADRERLSILQQMPALAREERVQLDLQLVALERRSQLDGDADGRDRAESRAPGAGDDPAGTRTGRSDGGALGGSSGRGRGISEPGRSHAPGDPRCGLLHGPDVFGYLRCLRDG